MTVRQRIVRVRLGVSIETLDERAGAVDEIVKASDRLVGRSKKQCEA